MADSYVYYTYDSVAHVTRRFTVPFEFIAQTYVKINLNNSDTDLEFGIHYTFHDASTIEIDEEVSLGNDDLIKIYRQTPATPLVDFSDGASLTETNLDTAFSQNRHIIEEASDNAVNLSQLREAMQGITYWWADEDTRNAQIGMGEGALGIQQDTAVVYRYDEELGEWLVWFEQISMGGGSTIVVVKEDHGFTEADLGKMLRKEGSAAGDYVYADASDASNAEVIGFISKVTSAGKYTITKEGVFSFPSTASADAVCGTDGGLTAPDIYWLKSTIDGDEQYS